MKQTQTEEFLSTSLVSPATTNSAIISSAFPESSTTLFENYLTKLFEPSLEVTSKQMGLNNSARTSKINVEEDITFSPMPFFKATIERVTLKPYKDNSYVHQERVSENLPITAPVIKVAANLNKTPDYNVERELSIDDLFHNSLNRNPETEKLVLYDTEYVKWLFNIFYREIKTKDLRSKVNYSKAKDVFLNMLAEIGSVRSKWLNRSMAKHYATHFLRKQYDNKKRFTLDADVLLQVSDNLNSLLAQYFDVEERIPNLTSTSSSNPTTYDSSSSGDSTIDSHGNILQNLPYSLKSTSSNQVSNNNTIEIVNRTVTDNKNIPHKKIQNMLENIRNSFSWESTNDGIYGGVSRNSGVLPTMAYKNMSQKVNHRMQEYSNTKNAIANDFLRLFESLAWRNQSTSFNNGNINSSSLASALNIAHFPQQVSRLLLDTIKRSKSRNIIGR